MEETPKNFWDALKVIALVGGGTAIPWLWKHANGLRGERRKEAQEDEETAISRIEKLLQRVEKDRADAIAECQLLHREINNLKLDLTELRVKSERDFSWTKYLEALLNANGIKFVSWKDTPLTKEAAENMTKTGAAP